MTISKTAAVVALLVLGVHAASADSALRGREHRVNEPCLSVIGNRRQRECASVRADRPEGQTLAVG